MELISLSSALSPLALLDPIKPAYDQHRQDFRLS